MGATNFHTSDEEEGYIDMIICCPNSPCKTTKQSSEFQRPFHFIASPADALFCNGKLLPLYAPARRRQTLHDFLHVPGPQLEQDEEDLYYYTITLLLPSTTDGNTTFSDSCSSMESCNDSNIEWSTKLDTFIGKKPMPRIIDRLKMVMTLICGCMVKQETSAKDGIGCVDTCVSRSCSRQRVLSTCLLCSSFRLSHSCATCAASSSFDSNGQHGICLSDDELIDAAIAHCKKFHQQILDLF